MFRNDERLASNEDSESVVNVERPRSVASRLGPAGSKIEAILRGTRRKENSSIDVYSVYLHKDGLTFGNKPFNMDVTDKIIRDILIVIIYVIFCIKYNVIAKPL